ncbi:MAG TPA: PKD domain-containing protein [Candidatus Thermoplasmatota archaeon]|nr:PKD domain-containing protein [Candidatus Thermoplasmatota archaeon]
MTVARSTWVSGKALGILVAWTLVVPALLVPFALVAGAPAARAHGNEADHGHASTVAASSFWNVVDGFTTKTGYRLVFVWDTDAPIAGIVEWGYAPTSLTNVVRPLGNVVDSAQMAVFDVKRTDVVPGKAVYFRVRDVQSGQVSPVQSFPMGNAWKSDFSDGVYEINALVQIDTQSLPDNVPGDQSLVDLAKGIDVMAERVWDMTDGYVRLGKVLITDTLLNYPVNQNSGPGICANSQNVEGHNVQHTIADFIIETAPPFDSHTWGGNPPVIDDECTGFYVGRAGWLRMGDNFWKGDLDVAATFVHELGHYAFGLDDLYDTDLLTDDGCWVGVDAPPNNANGNWDISVMYNAIYFYGTETNGRWKGTELDRANTPCDRLGGRVSWTRLRDHYTGIPALGRNGDGYPDHSDSDYRKPRGNPDGDRLDIKILDHEAGGSKVNHWLKATGEEPPGVPDITITDPTNGATIAPTVYAFKGNVHRFGSAGNAAPTASLSADVESGEAPLAVNFALAAADADGFIASWSLDFGDGTAPSGGAGGPPSSAAHTYAANGRYTARLVVEDDQGASAEAIDVINVGVGGEVRIGTDVLGDTLTATCQTGSGSATIACERSWVNAARDGFDLAAAWVEDVGNDIRFTIQVKDGSKFFVDPAGDPASGPSRIVGYNLVATFETSPVTSYTVEIVRDRGQQGLSGILGKNLGGLIALSDLDDIPSYDAATGKFSVHVPKDEFPEFIALSQLQALNAQANFVQQGASVSLIVSMDAELSNVENDSYTIVTAAVGPGDLVWRPAARAAPAAAPANPDITDPAGDVTTAGLPIPQMDIRAAWWDNDADHVYVGLNVEDIPADLRSASQVAYTAYMTPSWSTSWGTPGTFIRLRLLAVWSAIDAATVPPRSALVDGKVEFILQAMYQGTTGPTSFTLAELPGSSIDPDTNIVWWVVPRATLLQAPADGARFDNLEVNAVPAVRGVSTLGTAYGDSALGANPYTIQGSGSPVLAEANGPYSGVAGAPIAISGSGSGGAAPLACQWAGPADAVFASAASCATTVTFATAGQRTITLTVRDQNNQQATDTATVVASAATGEHVRILLDGNPTPVATVPVATTAQAPQAPWSIDVDLRALPGAHTARVEWRDADGALLDHASVSFQVTQGGAPFVSIATPEAGSVQSGVIQLAGEAGRGVSDETQASAIALGAMPASSKSIQDTIAVFCAGCEGVRQGQNQIVPANLGTSTAWQGGAGSPGDGLDGVWLNIAGYAGASYTLQGRWKEPADIWFFEDDLDSQSDATGSNVAATYPKNGAVPANSNWAFVYLRRPTAQNLDPYGETIWLNLTLPITLPTAPQNLQTLAGKGAVALGWSPPASNGNGAINYRVFRDGALIQTVAGASTQYLDSDPTLVPFRTYTYEVAAVNSAGQGPKSNAAQATPLERSGGNPPSAPTNLRATATTPTSIALAWDAATDDFGVKQYEVFRGNASVTPATGVFIGSTASLAIADAELVPGTTYHYVVRAVDTGDNAGPASATLSARTENSPEKVTLAIDGVVHDVVYIVTHGGSAPWSSLLDTRSLADGTHTLVATYEDGAGASATRQVVFEVDNTGPTPAVAITSPADGFATRPPVNIQGSYQAGGLPAGQAAGVAGVDRLDPTLLEWLSHPFVKGQLDAASFQAFVRDMATREGFLGAVPTTAGAIDVYLAGARGANFPDFAATGVPVRYVEHAVLEPLVTYTDKPAADVISLEAFEATFAQQGPWRPGVQQGVGPGGAFQFDAGGGLTGICTASFLMEHPVTKKYYLMTAGHCLLKNGVSSSVVAPGSRAAWVDVCIARCVNNQAGRGVGLGTYVRLSPSGSYHPVAFAQQWEGTSAQGTNNDIGFIEIPASLYRYLRPQMWFWGGPTGFDRPTAGEALVHYGHGAGYGATFPHQGRVGVNIDTTKALGVFGVALVAGGDSGSAIGTGAPRADMMLLGDGAAGTITHTVRGHAANPLGLGILWGTDFERGLDMAEPYLGRLALVTEDAAIRLPAYPDPATAGVSILAPGPGATFDPATATHVTVSGAGSFPLAGTPGTDTHTLYLHRTACGSGEVLYMDEVDRPNEGGNNCGSLVHPVAWLYSEAVVDTALAFKMTPAPATDIALDASRNFEASVFLSGYRGITGNPSPVPSIVNDFEVRLEAAGHLLGSHRTTNRIVLGPMTEIKFQFPVSKTHIPAGADVTLVFVVHQSTGPVFMSIDEPGVSRLRLPLALAATHAVEVSVDDPLFAPESLIPTTGTRSWTASWPLAGVSAGTHTLYARAVVNGVPAEPAASVTVEVLEEPVVGPVAGFAHTVGAMLDATFEDRSTAGSSPIVSWSWSLGDGDTSNAQHPTHVYAAPGTYTVTLTVTDANGLSNSKQADVLVAGGWVVQARLLDPTLDEVVGWTTRATPASGESGAWTLLWNPEGFPAPGLYTIEARLLLDGAAVASSSSTFSVPPNAPPVLDPIGTQDHAEGEVIAFTVSASDPDGDDVALRAEDLPRGAAFDVATGAFTWTPDHEQAGFYTVRFIADDGLDTDHEDVQFVVRETSRPPLLAAIGARAARESEALRIDVSASDPDGDALALSAFVLPRGATFVDNLDGTGVFLWTPALDQAGPYDIVFQATDGALKDEETVRITVANTNQAPVFAPIGPIVVPEMSVAAVTIGVSDPDGDTVTLAALALPPRATFNAAQRKLTLQPAHYSEGSYVATFRATDGSLSTTIDIPVEYTHVNRKPIAALDGPSAARLGALVAFRSLSTDVDGVIVEHRWNFGDGRHAEGRDVTHAFENPGTFVVTLTVVDNEGGQASRTRAVVVDGSAPTTTLAVAGPGQAPYFSGPATITAAVADNRPGSVTMISMNSAPATVYTGPITLSDEGAHVVRYWSVDEVGNAETARELTVWIDKTRPEAEWQSPKPLGIVGDHPTLAVQATDATSGVSRVVFSVDGVVIADLVVLAPSGIGTVEGPGPTYETTWDTRDARPGLHVLRVEVHDRAGHVEREEVLVLFVPTVPVSDDSSRREPSRETLVERLGRESSLVGSLP